MEQPSSAVLLPGNKILNDKACGTTSLVNGHHSRGPSDFRGKNMEQSQPCHEENVEETRKNMESSNSAMVSNSNNHHRIASRTQSKSRLLTRSHAVDSDQQLSPNSTVVDSSLAPSISPSGTLDARPTTMKKNLYYYNRSSTQSSSIESQHNSTFEAESGIESGGGCLSGSSFSRENSSEGKAADYGPKFGAQSHSNQSDQELLDFIIDTMNRNVKDRNVILRIESDLINFVKDTKRTSLPFPQMTSYQRMLVHRISAYFNLDHNLDGATGNCVIVSKSKETRLPEIRFRDYVKQQQLSQESDNDNESNPNRKLTMKRDKFLKPEDMKLRGNNMSQQKTVDDRSDDYNKSRRRMFSNDNKPFIPSENVPPWQQGKQVWSSTDSESSGGTKQLRGGTSGNTLRPPAPPQQQQSRLLKVESLESSRGRRQQGPQHPPVSKSYSFGGYTSSPGQQPPVVFKDNRLFTKQDSSSSSSGLSPASSGYKSQVNSDREQGVHMAEATVEESVHLAAPATVNSVTGVPLQMMTPSDTQQQQVVFWAVTDMNNVPPGSMIIDPGSGQAVKNADGTVYHFDPMNPPLKPPIGDHGSTPSNSYLLPSPSPAPPSQILLPPSQHQPAAQMYSGSQYYEVDSQHLQPAYAPQQQYNGQYVYVIPQPAPDGAAVTTSGPGDYYASYQHAQQQHMLQGFHDLSLTDQCTAHNNSSLLAVTPSMGMVTSPSQPPPSMALAPPPPQYYSQQPLMVATNSLVTPTQPPPYFIQQYSSASTSSQPPPPPYVMLQPNYPAGTSAANSQFNQQPPQQAYGLVRPLYVPPQPQSAPLTNPPSHSNNLITATSKLTVKDLAQVAAAVHQQQGGSYAQCHYHSLYNSFNQPTTAIPYFQNPSCAPSAAHLAAFQAIMGQNGGGARFPFTSMSLGHMQRYSQPRGKPRGGGRGGRNRNFSANSSTSTKPDDQPQRNSHEQGTP